MAGVANAPMMARRQSVRTPATRRESVMRETSDATQEARAEDLALIESLKQQLQQVEADNDALRRQKECLEGRTDEISREQALLDERLHEADEQIEGLRNEKREVVRQMREMEAIYEAERSAMVREKEEMANREEATGAVIQRLKDTLAARAEDERMGRAVGANAATGATLDPGSFAPPSSVQRSDSRSDSRNTSKVLLQKDMVIQELRLELAEAQSRGSGTDTGDGERILELERQLQETRTSNVRLIEDNERYEQMLQHCTLTGDILKCDFLNDAPSRQRGGPTANEDALAALEGTATSGSLADELSDGIDDGVSVNGEEFRLLEEELHAVKDQNKSLNLFINRILERLLQTREFENILEASGDYMPPQAAAALAEKALPQPPPTSPPQLQAPSFIERARSSFSGVGLSTSKPRPASVMALSTKPLPSITSDPETAPAIPIAASLTRGSSSRRRPMSEQFSMGTPVGLAAQMYRGLDGQMSPTFSGPRRAQTMSLASATRSGASTPATGKFPSLMRSDASSISSADSANELSTPPSQSPSRSEKTAPATYHGNKPRPLRLVQETAAAAANTNKRGSWMPNWLQRAPSSVSIPSPGEPPAGFASPHQ